jgi:hypothetical protein
MSERVSTDDLNRLASMTGAQRLEFFGKFCLVVLDVVADCLDARRERDDLRQKLDAESRECVERGKDKETLMTGLTIARRERDEEGHKWWAEAERERNRAETAARQLAAANKALAELKADHGEHLMDLSDEDFEALIESMREARQLCKERRAARAAEGDKK